MTFENASRNSTLSRLGASVRRAVRPVLSAILAANMTAGFTGVPALAASANNSDNQPARGTMLIPLTPKIDTSRPVDDGSTQATSQTSSSAPAEDKTARLDATVSASGEKLHAPLENIQPEQGNIVEGAASEETEVGEGTNLKGSVQITADDTEYDQQKNTFLGTGNAVVLIGGQDTKLEADTILYDQNNEVIDARGNVRIYRDGQVTTGAAFKFKVTSDEYLITKPDTEVQGTTVVARKGAGSKTGMSFRNGTMEMPVPFHLVNNGMYGPLGASEVFGNQALHPDAYLPSQPSFKFKARKIIYEKYKEDNNITIYGGTLMFGSFGVPLPKMVLTASSREQRAVMPISPMLVNNLQMGGTSIGPMFNYRVSKNGVFSWAPLVQLGGSTLSKTDPHHHSLGAGVRIQYVDNKLATHLAYGSNSNLLVADFKYKFNKNLGWQSGINRYLQDGVFGYRRARVLGEMVYTKTVSGIPYLTGITFRTAAGGAQDNPALLNQTPQLEKLYNLQNNNGKIFALRAQQQVTTSTQPLFSIGDTTYGAKMFIYGGAGVKGYSTGDTLSLAQAGPILDLKLNRLRLQTGYTQTAINGKSPFVFDQYIAGSRSATLNGDIRVCKYLTLGGMLGYNLDAKALYQKTIKVAVGPDDFKVLFSHDTLTGFNRFGVNVLYGAPVQYNSLVMKAGPDNGKLGGI